MLMLPRMTRSLPNRRRLQAPDSLRVGDLHPSAPTANTADFRATPKTLRGRFVNVKPAPKSEFFGASDHPWAPRSVDYNAGNRNGFGLDDNVYQSLLQNRIIFLGSEVKDENANAICAQMLLLNAEDPHKDIYLYINSPGGSVDSGMAIYDTMKWISNDVATVAIGLAASMGQFLLCAGEKGKRYALPHSRIMMHQPSGGLGGTASDIRIQAEQSLHIKSTMQKLIAEHTGQTLDQIEADSDRDRWFTAEQALAYGFIDHVFATAAQIPSAQAPNQ
jgi:ATP-dependent Clp protease protease subunit